MVLLVVWSRGHGVLEDQAVSSLFAYQGMERIYIREHEELVFGSIGIIVCLVLV